MNTIELERLYKICFNLLVAEEGFRETPYYCTENYPTVGIGFRVGAKGDPLQDIRMTRAEAEALLRDKIVNAEATLERQMPKAWSKCNVYRRAILISMAFQMGVTGLLGFRNTIAAIERAEWPSVASGMLDSRWARQTPKRASRHATAMLEGTMGVYVREGFGDLSK